MTTRPGVFESTLACQQVYSRIHLSFGQKNEFCIKRDDSKPGKIAPLQYKMKEALQRRATPPGVLKVLWYANKCITTDFRIRLFCGQKNDFCIKRDGSKIGKIALLQYKISEALWWRATPNGVFQSTLVCQQVYRDRFSNSSFLWSKK